MPAEESRDEADEFELGSHDSENEAFLPGETMVPRKGTPGHILMRWLPARLRSFLQTASRIKLVIICGVTFILLVALATYWNKKYLPKSLPLESMALIQELAKNLSDTPIPEYVLTYAPLVLLDERDPYFPSDMAAHIANTHPTVNFTILNNSPSPLTLGNLDLLNNLSGENVSLTSNSDLIRLPSYIRGQKPDPKTLQTMRAISCVVITVEKGPTTLDAFYMYFYSYNKGPQALGHEVGNHLGDWEHNMIRFQDGIPTEIWYSQHEYGRAYTYDAVQKIGQRPVAFSARGSHANYATAGAHDLQEHHKEIPKHIVFDRTSVGPIWDPTLSAYYYTYSPTDNKFTPAIEGIPEGYLYFQGQWGDEQRPDSMKGQKAFHGFYKWTAGPRGPVYKELDRVDVCPPSKTTCIVDTKL